MTAFAVSGEVKQLATKVRVTGEKVQELRLNHREKQIRDWLSAPDPSINYTNALAKRHQGTGIWFTSGQAFTTWKKQSNSFLWLHGIPGCGKTVLSSTIIEHLNRIATPTQALLYFYFDFNDTNKQTLGSMLRSLVNQLYQGQLDTRGALDQSWESHGEGNQQIPRTSLEDVLLAMLSKVNDVSIVLDALDESTARSDLLSWLRGILEAKSFSCRILVTARREEDIESALRRWTRPEDSMSIRKSDTEGDIREYVKHTVRNSEELDRWRERPDVQNEIEMELVRKADGM